MRIVDSAGLAAPITVMLSSFPTVADFSPDGPQLAIAAGNDVVVASTESGEVEETLQDHDGLVTAVEFRPTGELVTAGDDGAIITSDFGDWSAAFRSDLPLLDQVPAELDERTVALEQSDGRWQVVVAEPAVWEERACQVAGRVLTEEEWGELFGARPYAPACGERAGLTSRRPSARVVHPDVSVGGLACESRVLRRTLGIWDGQSAAPAAVARPPSLANSAGSAVPFAHD